MFSNKTESRRKHEFFSIEKARILFFKLNSFILEVVHVILPIWCRNFMQTSLRTKWFFQISSVLENDRLLFLKVRCFGRTIEKDYTALQKFWNFKKLNFLQNVKISSSNVFKTILLRDFGSAMKISKFWYFWKMSEISVMLLFFNKFHFFRDFKNFAPDFPSEKIISISLNLKVGYKRIRRGMAHVVNHFLLNGLWL